MNGLGNAICVLDAREDMMPLSSEIVAALADPAKGIGFDQLMVLEAPKNPLADVYTSIWNADGTQVGEIGRAHV